MMADRPRLLVLGGTAEAVAFVRLATPAYEIIYSLAGLTRNPSIPPSITVRSGGFGGADALAAWITNNAIDHVIDATHPFAQNIAANVANACTKAGIPRLKVTRPAWEETAGDAWHHASDIKVAAGLVPGLGKRVFLSVGRQEIGAFSVPKNIALFIRSIEQPDTSSLPPEAKIIIDRGPFTVHREQKLLGENNIDVVVSKNSGGMATYAKIEAARNLSLPVIMIARPPPTPGKTVETITAVLDCLSMVQS